MIADCQDTAATCQAEARRAVDDYAPPWPDFASFLADRKDEGKTYMIAVDRSGATLVWTVRAWRQTVKGLADKFALQYGVRAQDNVAVLATNTPQALASMFAIWLLGACVVPLDPRDNGARHLEIISDSGARHLVLPGSATASDLPGQVQSISIQQMPLSPRFWTRGRERHPLSLPALRMHSSGTSGKPKAIVVSMGSLLLNSHAMMQAFGWGRDSRILTVLPIAHANGLVINSFLPWFAGGSTVLVEKFSSSTFWVTAARTKATAASLVPTVLEYLLAAPERPRPAESRLREVFSGSGPLRPQTAVDFETKFNIPVRQLYGLSETTAVLTATPAAAVGCLADNRASIGTPVPHAEVRVMDANGNLCAENERGEIVARGAMLMEGYADNGQANETAFTGGWFHTGDLGYWKQAADGRPWFFLEGRKNETVVRGGINVSLASIDEVLNNHPDVDRAVAFPFANRWQGEEIAAYVVARNELTEDAFLRWCGERLENDRCPKVVIFGTDIPTTSVGKIKRRTLADQLTQRLSAHWDDIY